MSPIGKSQISEHYTLSRNLSRTLHFWEDTKSKRQTTSDYWLYSEKHGFFLDFLCVTSHMLTLEFAPFDYTFTAC